MPFLPIHTPRLTLRRFTADDLEAFQAYRTDPVVARYQGWQPMSDENARNFLTTHADQPFGAVGQWLQVAVALRATGRVIGDLGLCVTHEADRAAEIGFSIARPMQSQGYATEAVSAVFEALRHEMGIRAMIAITDTRNLPSIALLRRLGFEQTQTTPNVLRGEACEEHTFILTDRR